MSRVDEELSRRFRGATRPVDVDGLFEGLARRRSHRETLRKAQAAFLALAVLAATGGGFIALSSVFGGDDTGTPVGSVGRIAFGRVQLELFPSGGSIGHDFEIWSVAADGSDLRPVYTGDGSATTPAWSPDGTRIAFLEADRSSRDLGPLRLLWREADGSNPVVVIAEGLIEPAVRALEWSPDGTRIAVLDSKEHDIDAFDEFGLPLAEIAVYRLDGTRERLLDVPGGAGGFAWSPDGQGFAVSRVDAQGAIDLIRVDLEGRVVGLIAEDVAPYSPVWAPDGSRIAFTRQEVMPGVSDVLLDDVWTVAPDGTGERRLTEDGGRKPSLAWTPDGQRILFSRQTPDRCDIVSIRPDGSGRQVVADRAAMGGCAQEIATQPTAPTSASPEITVSPSPEPSRADEPGDIGLGFPLCSIQRLGDIDWYGDGTSGAAWTGARASDDGSCPAEGAGEYVVAADLDGDGLAEPGGMGFLDHCLFCRPFATTDLSADGVLELIVLEEGSSTPSYSIYEVSVPTSERSPGIYSLFVAPPGAPQANLPANEPIRLIVGGDEGFSGGLRCENYPEAPVIVYTWVHGEVDADTDLEAHETRLNLGEDGIFHVLDTNDFTIPRQPERPDLISEAPACGVDFHPAP
jgi:hypothetical protein